MRLLLIAAVAGAALGACSREEKPTEQAAVEQQPAGAAGMTSPTTTEALAALVGETSPNRAVACYALTSVHAAADKSQSQPRYAKVAALWSALVTEQAGDAALAEQKRTQAVAQLRATPEGVRRAGVVACQQPPVPGAAQMTEEQRTAAESEQSGRLYDRVSGPATMADLPDLLGEGADQRTVNCQSFTALQAAATSGAAQARYQAASDKWALKNRAEFDGDRQAAAQLMASTVAGFTNSPPAADVLAAGAEQCVTAAPATAPS